jgi:hypothetical protein
MPCNGEAGEANTEHVHGEDPRGARGGGEGAAPRGSISDAVTPDTGVIDDPLEQLLADVTRIADGVEAIHELAITVVGRTSPPPPAWRADLEVIALASTAALCRDSQRAGIPTVQMPARLVRVLLQMLGVKVDEL